MTMDSYTVRMLDGCRIVQGAIPVRDMAILLQGWADTSADTAAGEWLVDADLSARMGATLVAGHAADLDRLRQRWNLPHAGTQSNATE